RQNESPIAHLGVGVYQAGHISRRAAPGDKIHEENADEIVNKQPADPYFWRSDSHDQTPAISHQPGDHKRCSDGERQVRQASRLDRLNQGPPVGLEDHQRQRAKSDYELERPAKADPSKTVSFLRRYHCCLLLASGLGLNVDPDSGEFLESRGNVTWPDGRPPGGSWVLSKPN